MLFNFPKRKTIHVSVKKKQLCNTFCLHCATQTSCILCRNGQIVLLIPGSVGIRYIFHLFISFYFIHWQYLTREVTLYWGFNQNQSKCKCFLSLFEWKIQSTALNKQNLSFSYQSRIDKSLLKIFCLFKSALNVF